jgi:uncharacterized protein (TIGR00369 family)
MKLPSLAGLVNSKRNMIRELWDKLAIVPGGARMYSELVGKAAPYTGTIGAKVKTLRKGYAEVTLKETRAVQNHLKSVHAVALANLAEMTGNLALAYSMPDDARFIVSSLHVDYHKKARGELLATCYSPTPTSSERRAYDVPVTIFDASGAIVCTATLSTLVGPKPNSDAAV